MKVLIISTNRHQFPVPVIPLGACMVAEAAQKAGHEVRMLDMMFEKDPLKAIHRELTHRHPEVIGLSVRNIDNNNMHSPVFFLKELFPIINTVRGLSTAPIVLGGAAVPVMPEELLRYTGAEMAVLGDGEKVFPMVLEELSRGEKPCNVPGVAWIESGIFRSNPCLPAKNGRAGGSPDLFRRVRIRDYLGRLSSVPLQSKLGCHFKCIYCTYRKIEGDDYRLNDPDEVVDTVKGLASRGLCHMEFVDNVFNSPYEHALSICEKLAQASCGASLMSLELNPLFLDDRLMGAMEKAGFTGIGITVESASDNILEGLRKGFSAEHVYRAAEVVRRHDIPCVWIFMLGAPRETRETVKETLRFAENFITPRDVAFFGTGIRIYPGTEIEAVARKQGLLSVLPKDMLEPAFYVSPSVEESWMHERVKASLNRHLNFIDPDSIRLPVLPAIHRLGYRLGLRPPLWKHTRLIRRVLRTVRMEQSSS